MSLRAPPWSRGVCLVAAVAAVAGPAAHADEPEFEPDPGLQHYVSVSAKITQTVQQTPASVYVITAEDIERAGYRSVGEALRSVPGLFVSYDLVNYHVGVRGVFGGSRSGSRMLKVMIDGRPVALVQSGTYLLGPEFAPISAIERIEVMRGPASALYGAGALVGAVNVVTRRPPYEGAVTTGADARFTGGTLGQDAGAIDAVVTLTGDAVFALAGFAGSYEDRSGLGVAPGPFADDYAGEVSRGDLARPRVFLGRVEARVAGGRLAATALGQYSERTAEFHDLTVLSHGTRVALFNWNLGVAYEKPFARSLSLRGSAGLSLAGPLGRDRFDFDPETAGYTGRAFASREVTGALELVKELGGGAGLALAGVDLSLDHEELPQILRVDGGGDVIAEMAPPARDLGNLAGYAQVLHPAAAWALLAAGARYDHHTVYGGALTGRAAIVVRPTERLSLKALAGRSYKAPSPEQLYGNPLSPHDIAGNESIRPQYVQGAELVADLFVSRFASVAVDAYYNQAHDALAYLLRGGQLVATPYDARTIGGEVSIRHARSLPPAATRLAASLGLQQTLTSEALVGGLVEKPVPDDETFPNLIAGVEAGVRVPAAHLDLHAAFRHVGARVPSQSNLRASGDADMRDPGYLLPAYGLLDVAVSAVDLAWPGLGKGSAMLKLENLLDERYAEVGFNGVDVSGLGRVLWVQLRFAR